MTTLETINQLIEKQKQDDKVKYKNYMNKYHNNIKYIHKYITENNNYEIKNEKLIELIPEIIINYKILYELSNKIKSKIIYKDNEIIDNEIIDNEIIDNEIIDNEIIDNENKKIKKIRSDKVRFDNCQYENGCDKIPYYNIKTEKNAKFCIIHKTDEMINIKNKGKLCQFENGCDIIASFNNIGETKGLYCSIHKKPNMIDIIHKKCLFDGCNHQPSFNFKGNKTPLYCATHKQPGMICIISKKCIIETCDNLNPIYNFKGLEPLYCIECKLPNMVNVKSKMCITCNEIHARFNYKGQNQGLYCFKDKLPDMVNVVDKKCEYVDEITKERCDSRPSFNNDGEKTKRFCKKHKNDNMINVKDKKCIGNDNGIPCNIVPTFNFKNETSAIYCKKHKDPKMVDIRHKLCLEDECDKRPNFNFPNTKVGLYCFKHKKPEMIDVANLSKKCKFNICNVRGIEKYEGYCAECAKVFIPDNANIRNFMTKELNVRKFIEDNFNPSIFNWSFNKIIENGKFKRRPDFLLKLTSESDKINRYIIIEVDENQHNNYECNCETKRINEIAEDLNFNNIVFIRFNPDDYIDENNKKINSCWRINKKTGKLEISSNKEWNHRLNILKDQINYWISNNSDKPIETIELFYDKN